MVKFIVQLVLTIYYFIDYVKSYVIIWLVLYFSLMHIGGGTKKWAKKKDLNTN